MVKGLVVKILAGKGRAAGGLHVVVERRIRLALLFDPGRGMARVPVARQQFFQLDARDVIQGHIAESESVKDTFCAKKELKVKKRSEDALRP